MRFIWKLKQIHAVVQSAGWRKEAKKDHQTVLGVGEANLSGRGKLKKKKEVSKEQEGEVGWTSIHVHRILPR